MIVKFKKLTETAKQPTYATDGAACFDFYADDAKKVFYHETVSTGISVEIPIGHAMLIYSRSGHAAKYNVRLSNCVGVIDSDYRGEVKIMLIRDGVDKVLVVEKGDRIAQGMIVPVERVEFVECEELSETDRGNGGFGSTGIK